MKIVVTDENGNDQYATAVSEFRRKKTNKYEPTPSNDYALILSTSKNENRGVDYSDEVFHKVEYYNHLKKLGLKLSQK